VDGPPDHGWPEDGVACWATRMTMVEVATMAWMDDLVRRLRR
jgi:hypothetical protein